jgi:hypothetical protein
MTRLSEKQMDLLAALEVLNEESPPTVGVSTFELYNTMQVCHEDAGADSQSDLYRWRDWTREGIYATMLRLERRGLVRRCSASGVRDRSLPVGRFGIAPIPGRPRYGWRLTDAGHEAAS